MHSIEDLVRYLSNNFIKYKQEYKNRNKIGRDKQFLDSILSFIDEEKPLTHKQIQVIVKIMDSLNGFKQDVGEETFKSIIDNQKTDNGIIESKTVLREMKAIGNSLVALRFKYSKDIKDHIKSIESAKPMFNKEYKLWILHVNPRSVDSIERVLIKNDNFYIDDETRNLIEEVKKSKEVPKNEGSLSEEDEYFVFNTKRGGMMTALLKAIQVGENNV